MILKSRIAFIDWKRLKVAVKKISDLKRTKTYWGEILFLNEPCHLPLVWEKQLGYRKLITQERFYKNLYHFF